ncbi:MAG: putative toxin-antitoxin system toxin component, PIN family, partial [Clostridia bacterium]|nr:putative toxin-antitoxin system toxin component, PIN family [Clostridia bacterium]
YNALSFIKVVPTPETAVMAEDKVRDPKDRPILRAALDAHADLFLTGDKDFLESSITDPRIISVAEFLGREE